MEYIELEMLRMKELRPEIPCWAKAEKMPANSPRMSRMVFFMVYLCRLMIIGHKYTMKNRELRRIFGNYFLISSMNFSMPFVATSLMCVMRGSWAGTSLGSMM